MRINIRAKNLELTAGLSSFVDEKIQSLKKFVDVLKHDDDPAQGKTLAEVFVEIEKETKHHRKGDIFRAEAKIALPGKTIMAEAVSDDLTKAVVDLKDELQQELKKYKLKESETKRREQRKYKKDIM